MYLGEDRQHRHALRELRHELAVHLLQAVRGNEVHRHVHSRILHLVQRPCPPRVLQPSAKRDREQCVPGAMRQAIVPLTWSGTLHTSRRRAATDEMVRSTLFAP